MEKPRSNERERIKAEKMFDKALLTLQNLKESPDPIPKPTRAPKKKAPLPPPPATPAE